LGAGNILKLEGEEVNASGHRDQLQRQYSIWSICGLALTIDNAWVALGGSIVVAVGMLSVVTRLLSPISCIHFTHYHCSQWRTSWYLVRVLDGVRILWPYRSLHCRGEPRCDFLSGPHNCTMLFPQLFY
jgi:hypothetical protein